MPDLVIVDVRLPGMNGLETFEAIHALKTKIPVIVMTTYGTTETAIEATKRGAFDYVLKPFEIPDMLSIIGQGLGTGTGCAHARAAEFREVKTAGPGRSG